MVMIVNSFDFPVFSIHDVSMTKEAQKKYHIKVKTLRIETHIPIMLNSIFTSDVVMAAFFSAETLSAASRVYAPVCLLEKKINNTKLLEGYHCYQDGYCPQVKFIHILNGFLGCSSFLNLGFYLLKIIAQKNTRSISIIYFVNRRDLDNDSDDENCDTSLEEFLQSVKGVILL